MPLLVTFKTPQEEQLQIAAKSLHNAQRTARIICPKAYRTSSIEYFPGINEFIERTNPIITKCKKIKFFKKYSSLPKLKKSHQVWAVVEKDRQTWIVPATASDRTLAYIVTRKKVSLNERFLVHTLLHFYPNATNKI